jgi:Plasmid encoded RepA protein
MADVHHLITLHGRDGAKERMAEHDRHLVDLAANVLESESDVGITYSGFCLTSLPHKRIGDTDMWERPGETVTLVIAPGNMRIGGKIERFGVPFGSRARMILLYLQTQALRYGSPEVELGKSLNGWMKRMGVPLGGKSRDLVREQANRLSACNLSFYYHNRKGQGFEKDSIIRSGFSFAASITDGGEDPQPRLWEDSVRLGDLFFKALVDSPVLLHEAALREISNQSMTLDIYIWLSYLLPTLANDKRIEWQAIQRQFGAGYDVERYFRAQFLKPLHTALAVYPEARVAITDDGLVLSPSRPPIEQKIHSVRLVTQTLVEETSKRKAPAKATKSALRKKDKPMTSG